MAHHMGISFATVNRWEKGRTKPTGLSLSMLEDVSVGGPEVVPGAEAAVEEKKTVKKRRDVKRKKKTKARRKKRIASKKS